MLNYISTFNDEYQKLFSTPVTASSAVAPVATVSHPAESGAGVFDMFPTDKMPFNLVKFAFFGAGSFGMVDKTWKPNPQTYQT